MKNLVKIADITEKGYVYSGMYTNFLRASGFLYSPNSYLVGLLLKQEYDTSLVFDADQKGWFLDFATADAAALFVLRWSS